MASSKSPSWFAKLWDKGSHVQSNCYEPFTRDGQIRLVKIKQDRSKPHEIKLSLSVVDLHRAPPFVALSYTWGKPEFDHMKDGSLSAADEKTYDLYCNGSITTVQENLFHFLKLVITTKAEGTIPHWIDALCIDQANLAERSKQVAFMGHIYKAADKVVVWLGRDDPHPDVLWISKSFCGPFIDMMRQLTRHDGDLGVNAFLAQQDPLLAHDVFIENLGGDVCQQWRKCWRSFFKFIATRRWFSRGWVLQEVVLKRPDRFHMLSGDYSLDWWGIILIVRYLRTLGWDRKLFQLDQINSNGYYVYNAIGAMSSFIDVESAMSYGEIDGRHHADSSLLSSVHHLFGEPSETQRFFVLLGLFITSLPKIEVTDPRDYIYSWLGLSSLALPIGAHNPIVPNYHHSVEEVFIKFAAVLLENIPLLAVLYMLPDMSYRQLSGLPSWVPDLIALRQARRESLLGYNPVISRGLDPSTLITFDASRTELFQSYRPSVSGSILTLHGLCVDRITRKVFTAREDAKGFISDVIDSCVTAAEDAYWPTSEAQIEAILRTLFANTPPFDIEVSELTKAIRNWILDGCAVTFIELLREGSDGTLYKRLFQQLEEIESSPKLLAFLPGLKEVEEKFQSGSISKAELASKPMSGAFMRCYHDRYMFWTRQGFVSLGPRSAEEGDEIWLLTGSKVPFILRKSSEEDNYSIVGEAYMHGAMHGELMTDDNVQRVHEVRIN